jgi:hypothetical protein
MATNVKPIPEGYHSVTPYLIIKGAAEAIEYYKKSFGATELFRMPTPDGKIGHAELKSATPQSCWLTSILTSGMSVRRPWAARQSAS